MIDVLLYSFLLGLLAVFLKYRSMRRLYTSYITIPPNVLLWINVKKLQFIHKLTASDTSKTAKITKGDITHQHIA